MEKEKQENLLDKIGISFHRKQSFKLIIIGFLVLLLLIPKMMILSLINERSINAELAEQEVMSKWSNAQTITGPVLCIPFVKKIYNEKEEKYMELTQTATFLPKTLHINGRIEPKNLYRSIYDVVVYQSDLVLDGQFDYPDFKTLGIPENDVLWNQMYLELSLSDLRGINEEVKLQWNSEDLVFSPGLTNSCIGKSGISVSIADTMENAENYFRIDLKLKGSKSLLFTPLGEKTEVNISSTWNDPGFTGSFLPKDRKVDQDGFEAYWNVLHFNRNFPQQWINDNGNYKTPDADFGVELITMADHYQKNTRSAKYAILIILITFIIFFMYEVFSKQRIHVFQYLMVGSAITLFYLLLLSVTEHLGFNVAYVLSALAVLILVVLYSGSFMHKTKNWLGLGVALATCFGFVYILLQLETYALLAGSIGLFALLAILMYITRKINWYQE